MLKVDVYVKIVLMIIAVSLLAIAFRPVFNVPAEAREGGHPPSITITEGRGRGHLMLWLAGDDGIKLVEFSDVGRVNKTYFISYSNLLEDNWIYETRPGHRGRRQRSHRIIGIDDFPYSRGEAIPVKVKD